MNLGGLFKIEQLSYFYPEQEREALNAISLTVHEGEFVLIVGPSGGGKSTLARVLSGFIPEFYGGRLQGQVFFQGHSLIEHNQKEWRKKIGFVFQDPERQIIRGVVENDLAFGLENLGLSSELMKRRINETLNFLNLYSLRERACHELSGGEKQKVALGSILAMMPRVLVLDEPTSQLDPAASQEMVGILGNLHREHGLTIILIEQKIEPYLHLADRIIFLEEGKIVLDEKPREFLRQTKVRYPQYTPSMVRLADRAENPPLNVPEARSYLRSKILNPFSSPPAYGGTDFPPPSVGSLPAGQAGVRQGEKVRGNPEIPLLNVEGVFFSYEMSSFKKETLSEINFQVHPQEFFGVLGENGAGKSTLLKIMAGFLKPLKGKVILHGQDVHTLEVKKKALQIAYLSQNPNDYLFNDTVEGELKFTMDNLGLKDLKITDEILEALGLTHLRFRYPRDLSAGQRQRAALASVLVAEPRLILLDEPTRGLDHHLRNELGILLKKWIVKKNLTVICVTQDVEFAAEFADRILLLSEGKIMQQGTPQEVLDGNLFYSTAINRIFRGIVDGVVNVRQAEIFLKTLNSKY